MTQTALPSEHPAVPSRIHQRLTSLGLSLMVVEPDGRVLPQPGCAWLTRLVLEAPAFHAALRSRLDELAECQGQVCEVWPGLWLAPLPAPRRRRSGPATLTASLPAVALAGAALLESDELRLLCSAGQLDFQATLAQVDRVTLVTAMEAKRLAASLWWTQQDTLEIERRHQEIETLSQQLGESYEELSLLYKFSTNMVLNQSPAQFLTEACMELQQVSGLKWMALQLVDDEPALNELAGQVFTAGPVGCDPRTLSGIGQALMRRQAPGAAPLVVDDVATLHVPALEALARHLLLVWLVRNEKPLGILFGGDKIDGGNISSVDSKLCNSLASTLAIFLENRMLYEDMAAMFLGTLHALTSSIDAKDKYTHGHSERVALLSRQLAAAAGLEEQTVERVYISGLVHDVGKIGVPEAVLCKPGQLTREEFALIKMHPEIGARILQGIRQMSDLIPGVLYHHERWDGKGYPHGIGGYDIPLFGRLICLADSFDAMSSNRTYRASLAHRNVLDEVRYCAGKQFDPELAEVFLQLDFAPFLQLVAKHQAQMQTQAPPLTAGDVGL